MTDGDAEGEVVIAAVTDAVAVNVGVIDDDTVSEELPDALEVTDVDADVVEVTDADAENDGVAESDGVVESVAVSDDENDGVAESDGVRVGGSPGGSFGFLSDEDLGRELDIARDAGMFSVRIDIDWSVVEPRPGRRDWASTDRIVDAITVHVR